MIGLWGRWPIWGMRSRIKRSAMFCNATVYRPRRDEIEAGLHLYAIPQAPAEPHRRDVRAIAGRVVHAHERTHLEGCVDPVKLVAEAAAESGNRRAAVPQLRFVDAHTAA